MHSAQAWEKNDIFISRLMSYQHLSALDLMSCLASELHLIIGHSF